MEVLALLAEGLSNQEIADRLTIARGTAKNHVSNILSKLGVRDRTKAVLRAQEIGLL
jgi:ATP/maltotriose-dependent transcriptional regulator MalT